MTIVSWEGGITKVYPYIIRHPQLFLSLTQKNIVEMIDQGSSYFIYYCGPKQLALSIPDERNREAVLDNIDSFLVARLCWGDFWTVNASLHHFGWLKQSHVKRESSTFQKKRRNVPTLGSFGKQKHINTLQHLGWLNIMTFFDSINFHPIFNWRMCCLFAISKLISDTSTTTAWLAGRYASFVGVVSW